MQRMHSITDQEAGPSVEPIFAMIKKKFGRVVNMFRYMANSPIAVQAFSSLSECSEKSSLGAELRHQISLLVSQENNCTYCIAAHSQIAKAMRLSDEKIVKARKGIATDPKSQAILRFCKGLIEKKGSVSDHEVQALKDAGVSDEELCDIILVVTFNIFTNYFNIVVEPELDFPQAPTI